ncbi:isoprenylcysteine carboxylmethyltransferase family protein [Deinococcus aquaedulcis]|uniref:isoprenylcysteine carboxylmethyltransferase family protein n=1 Tax=Deinococcus aquaedulcis TaxID=2840455 RepID=UPI001C838190|nr:isoprenylcysteine carboxylmethyltransferase family protein [Deinococcus aquaedulcis]
MKARLAAPLLVGALGAQRLLELRVARANERWARERGAVEYGQAHYPLFFVLHPAWLLGTLLEGRRAGARVSWPALGLLLLAQPLRYWVIRTLGRYWNTRILIVPGGQRVTGGPFRYLKHPNYAVVALELAAAPLAVGAWRTALAFTLLNAALLLGLRIPAEEAALRAYAQGKPDTQGRE